MVGLCAEFPACFRALATAILLTAFAVAGEEVPGDGRASGHLSFRGYGIEQGLRDPSINCLAQDRFGFVWCGTGSGLTRFSGGQITNFDSRDGLPGESVRSICEGADGTLWIGSTRGLACRVGDRFHGPNEEKGLPAVSIQVLALGPEGRVWAGTPKGLFLQSGPMTFVPDAGWPGGQVTALCASTDGDRLFAARWVGGQAQVLVRQQGAWTLLESSPSMGKEPIQGLVMDLGQTLWARSLGGLWWLREGRFQEGPRMGRARRTCSLFRDPKWGIWTNAGEGLSWTDGRRVESITAKDGLPESVAQFVLIDREGSLWAGGEGIFRLRGGGVWRSFGKAEGLGDLDVWCIFQDRDGARWVGTDRGLARLTARGFRTVPGTESTLVRSIVQGPDGLLYLTGSHHILSFEPRQGRIREIGENQGFKDIQRIYRLRFDLKGDLWVGTENHGLLHGVREGGGWKFQREVMVTPHPEESVQDVALDGEGRLWATGKQGLAVRDQQGWRRFTTQDGLRTNDVTHVVVLRNGDILGSYVGGKGIFRARLVGGQFRILEHLDNFVTPGSAVYLIGEDAQQNLWVGTGNGLDLITPGKEGIHFTTADGLAGDDINNMAFLAEKDGAVWIGTSSGVARFDPGVFRGIPTPPKSFILSHSLGGHAESRASDARLRVPRSSIFEVHFSSPSFIQENSLQTEVRLLGMEEEWRLSSGWSERFPMLPPGEYGFEVRSRIGRGKWGPSAILSFTVLPAWWQTWWATTLYLGLGTLAIMGVIQLRTRILRRRNVLLQARIDAATLDLRARESLLATQAEDLRRLNEQKNHFLGIVAHDLRNPLSGIILSAELLAEEGDPAEISRVANRIRKEGLEMSSLLGRFLDIAAIESGQINAEPESVDLTGLVHQVASRHAARAKEKGLELKVDFPQTVVQAWVDNRFTKEVLDNLISNAIKFSPPGKAVTLRCEVMEDSVVVSVEDQGPGLTEEDRQKLFGRFSRLSAQPTGGEKSVGLGLSIVKHMVEGMHGRIWVESEPGNGASFRVELPRVQQSAANPF